uniref:Vacuolar protein sorting-associated protein 25-like n=1 Tax=Nicotiana tabacum TaxID=4097 RepID=A0A1S4DQ68_TOBAC
TGLSLSFSSSPSLHLSFSGSFAIRQFFFEFGVSLGFDFLNFSIYDGVVGSLNLQPVRETREKQIQLWKELIIDFCRTQKVFVIGLEEDFPLFSNPAIESECFFLLVFYMSDVQLRSCVIYITLTIAFAKMNSRCLEIHNASDLEHQWNVKYQFM